MYLINHNLNVNVIPIKEGVLVPAFVESSTTNRESEYVDLLQVIHNIYF